MKWHKRFLELAKHISTWSKDPSSRIGAVIVDTNRRIVSTGYNGFAKGVKDSENRLNDREWKYKSILHAEENAILFAKRDLGGCSIYISGLPPCSHCASIIIQSGIKHVYYYDREIPERWKENMELSISLLNEAGVETHKIEE